jgi:tetratricopeptide (TPR) repeat protein
MRRTGFRLSVAVLSVAVVASCARRSEDHVKRGDQLVLEKKYSAAIIEYRMVLQKDAKNGEVRLKLGDVYAWLSDTRNAYREYVRAADTMPDNVDAQLKAGALLLMGNQFAEAKVRAEIVLRKSPRHPGGLTLLGNALAGLNDMSGAFERLTEAIAADPSGGVLYSNLGALQLARGDRQMAEASFKKAVRATPNAVSAHISLAHFYRSQGRDVDAEATLKEALQIDGQNVQVNSNLAEMYVRTGRAILAEAPLKAVADALKTAPSQFALAEYYLRTNRAKQASAILDKLAATQENYALAKARLAAIDYSQGRAAEAHKTLDELLKRAPGNRAALLLKARLLHIEKKFDEAMPFAKAAAAADPSNGADAYFVTAQIYVAKGRLEEALDALRQVLKLDPRSAPAQLALARLYAAKGDKQPAIEFAQQAVAIAPSDPDARLTLVRALLATGDTERAETQIATLLTQFPSSAPVHVQVGALYLARKDQPRARTAFTRALDLDAASAEALAGLVTLDLGARNASAALGRLEARLRAAPDDGRAWYLAARAYAIVGDLTRTEQALRKTIELDPANAQAFGMLGDIFAMRGKLEDATHEFEKWSNRQPRSIAAHTMVALLLEKQHKQPEARRRYERILEIDPQAAIAANNLAWLYTEAGGNLDLATDLAQRAKSQVPDQPAFNDTLGWIYYKKDLVEQAVPFFTQAIEKDGDTPLYHYHLGLAYAKQGEDSRAIASLKRALTLDARFDGADEARRVVAELQIP